MASSVQNPELGQCRSKKESMLMAVQYFSRLKSKLKLPSCSLTAMNEAVRYLFYSFPSVITQAFTLFCFQTPSCKKDQII